MNILKYLGREWESAADGEGFDCWGLVREVYHRELGVSLPVIPVDASSPRAVVEAFRCRSELSLFSRVAEPFPLCVVGMSAACGDAMSHVGIYFVASDGPRVLHNMEVSGVVCQALSELSLYGFSVVGFYQYG